MKDIWCFKQALFIFTSHIEDFQLYYEEEDLRLIRQYLGIINSFSDVTKRELFIDTKLQYESEV